MNKNEKCEKSVANGSKAFTLGSCYLLIPGFLNIFQDSHSPCTNMINFVHNTAIPNDFMHQKTLGMTEHFDKHKLGEFLNMKIDKFSMQESEFEYFENFEEISTEITGESFDGNTKDIHFTPKANLDVPDRPPQVDTLDKVDLKKNLEPKIQKMYFHHVNIVYQHQFCSKLAGIWSFSKSEYLIKLTSKDLGLTTTNQTPLNHPSHPPPPDPPPDCQIFPDKLQIENRHQTILNIWITESLLNKNKKTSEKDF